MEGKYSQTTQFNQNIIYKFLTQKCIILLTYTNLVLVL